MVGRLLLVCAFRDRGGGWGVKVIVEILVRKLLK